MRGCSTFGLFGCLVAAMSGPVMGQFADKPHALDAAANAHVTGTAPVLCIPLVDHEDGLDDIGTGATDATYSSTANPISFASDEGGAVSLDYTDDQVLKLPIPADAVTRAAGTIHWRLKLPANMPVDSEFVYFASSGRGVGAPAGAGQYNVRINATDLVLEFRSSTDGSASEYSVAHSASGIAANGVADIHFVWGTGGVRLYVNGVASPDNAPSNTGSVIIRAAAQGGTGEEFGELVLFVGSLDVTLGALGWTIWAQEMTPTQIASHREDPHWPQRPVLDLDTPAPQFSIDSNGLNLLMAFASPADATTLSWTATGTNVTSTTATYSGVTTQRLRNVLTLTDVGTTSTVAVTYKYPDGGNTDYAYYTTTATTGKAAGSPESWTLPAIETSTYRLVIIADFHGNKGATFADHIGDAGGLNNTGIGPTPQTQAQFWEALDEIQGGVVAHGPNFVLSMGDDIQGGTGYCSTQGVSDALERVATNLMIESLSAAPSARVIGNHEGTDAAAGCGEIRQESIRRNRLNPPGHNDANYEDWGIIKAGPLEIFMLNEYPLTSAGDTSIANQIVALETWAAASTSAFKAVAMHGMCCSGGFRGGLPEMDPDLLDAMIENEIDFSLNGHDHVGYAKHHTVGEHTLHVLQGPGVPFHLRYDSPPASYSGHDYFQQSWGYIVIDLTPGGETPIAIKFRRTGSWTWTSESGSGYDNGVQSLGLSLPLGQIAYQWPAVASSFQGATGVHFVDVAGSFTGQTGVHYTGDE